MSTKKTWTLVAVIGAVLLVVVVGVIMMSPDKEMMGEKMMGEKMMDEKMMDEKMMDEKMMDEKMMDEEMMGEKMMDEEMMMDRSAAAPIRIPIHNWSSQIVGAYIVGNILKQEGFKAEYVPSDSQVVYTSMCEGDIDLVHEVWQGAFGVAFEKVVDEGCVIDAATHEAKTREEWWYPAYVEEQCPGLPDWKALNACANLFATAETKPKGRFLAGPVDWLKHDDERVEGLGIDFEVVNAGSAAALWAELKSASENNRPIVLFNWTPNFIEALYEGKFIEFPEYAEACRKDASWGINKSKTYDCGNPKDGYLKIGVSKTFAEDNPEAYEIIRKIDFSNLDIAVMAKLADVDGMEPEEAASKWMEDNDKWQTWK